MQVNQYESEEDDPRFPLGRDDELPFEVNRKNLLDERVIMIVKEFFFCHSVEVFL